MRLRHAIKTASGGVTANRSRSFLTILGIVIGITSIILIVSIGRGTQTLILNELGALGAETVVIRPGKEPKGPFDVASTLFSDSLKERDVQALTKTENVPDLEEIMPALIVPGSISYGGETFEPDILGGSAEFFGRTFDAYPEEGVLFSDTDISQKSDVVVIGQKVKRELFGDSDALGEQVKIKDRKFRVVGIFPPKGQLAFINMDELAIIPYTTAQTYILGIDYYHEIIVRVSEPEIVPEAVRDIEATLRESHNITSPDDDDFFVITQQGLVDQIKIITSLLTALLSSVVAIALVVGGIGVMNVMLVSVTERTREIGLRKALGATNQDIKMQFLLESVMLTGIGGLVGIGLGALFSFLASFALSFEFKSVEWSFPVLAAVLGVGVSVLVGLVFGIYPAKQAAKKNPIDALRYE